MLVSTEKRPSTRGSPTTAMRPHNGHRATGRCRRKADMTQWQRGSQLRQVAIPPHAGD